MPYIYYIDRGHSVPQFSRIPTINKVKCSWGYYGYGLNGNRELWKATWSHMGSTHTHTHCIHTLLLLESITTHWINSQKHEPASMVRFYISKRYRWWWPFSLCISHNNLKHPCCRCVHFCFCANAILCVISTHIPPPNSCFDCKLYTSCLFNARLRKITIWLRIYSVDCFSWGKWIKLLFRLNFLFVKSRVWFIAWKHVIFGRIWL